MIRKFLILLVGSLLTATNTFSQLTYLTRTTPENEGLHSKDVLNFVDNIMKQKDTDIHGVMVLRNGKVVAEKYNEPFAQEYSHTLYSCSKTFTGVAVGLAVEDSLLTINDSIVKFFPELPLDSLSDTLQVVTVRDLLTMQLGIPVDTKMRTIENEWAKAYLTKSFVALPGTLYAYDSIDSYLLSAIVQRVTGKTIFEYLKERIFTPMGITQVAWEESPEGVSCGGWGLYMQLESMAKFGQLILQKGVWNGQQLVSSEWIDEMCKHQSTNTNGQMYGYHIWVMNYPGVVKCDGAYGQYIYIIPDKNMVVAITQCMRGNGNLENSEMWNLSRSATNQKLPPSNEYNTLLAARYRLTPTKGKAFSNKHLMPVKLDLGRNKLGWKSVEFEFGKQKLTTEPTLKLKVRTENGKKFNLVCTYQKWHTNEIKGYPLNLRPFLNNFSNIKGPFYAASSYGWTTDDDLYVRIHYINWLSSCRLHFRFRDGVVQAEILTSETTKSVGIITSVKR